MRKNVLLLEPLADEALELLKEQVEVLVAYKDLSLEEILKSNSIHAVITRGKQPIDARILDACPDLQVAARCGVGLDNVDVINATAHKVMVVNAPGSNAATIAEHTLTLMLMLMRNMYQSAARVKAGEWNWRNQYEGDELAGKTLGIIGMGNIGKRVARLAEAFGMKIVYWSRTEAEVPYTFLTLDELLQQSDVVSLHVPLSQDTKHLISEQRLNLMKPGALLINTARGALIDEKAIVKALNQGKLAGFGADVLTEEPPSPDNALYNHPKTIVTPHTGSLTATTFRNMCITTVTNVLAILSGKEPQKESIFNRRELGI
jgi:D-3-phosphoglycerate dehydrogenase